MTKLQLFAFSSTRSLKHPRTIHGELNRTFSAKTGRTVYREEPRPLPRRFDRTVRRETHSIYHVCSAVLFSGKTKVWIKRSHRDLSMRVSGGSRGKRYPDGRPVRPGMDVLFTGRTEYTSGAHTCAFNGRNVRSIRPRY